MRAKTDAHLSVEMTSTSLFWIRLVARLRFFLMSSAAQIACSVLAIGGVYWRNPAGGLVVVFGALYIEIPPRCARSVMRWMNIEGCDVAMKVAIDSLPLGVHRVLKNQVENFAWLAPKPQTNAC